MTINNICVKIDLRGKCQHYGLGNIALTDAELRTQLTNYANTAIADLVQSVDVKGAELKIEIVNGSIVVSLKVDNKSVSDIVALEAAVGEYLENELEYMWWQENYPRFANDSSRLLLKSVVKSRVKALAPEPIPPKRKMVLKEIPVTRYEYRYEDEE